MRVTYYTDGSCLNNGKQNAKGGAAFVCIKNKDTIVDQWQEFYNDKVTNNRMELKAILFAIIHIHNNEYDKDDFNVPIIYSDSSYCVNTINNWMYNWQNNNWIKNDGKVPENLDIIKKIWDLKQEGYKFYLEKIKGHAGHQWNEYADKLATGEIIIGKTSEDFINQTLITVI